MLSPLLVLLSLVSILFFILFFFFFDLYSRTPLTENLGLMHMPHQFMTIPTVFSQCAPLRSMIDCVSQLGLVYANATPHHFTQLSHTMLHMHSHLYTYYTCTSAFLCIHLHCFPFECHHISFSPHRTINKQYNMAHQEAPYRPVS